MNTELVTTKHKSLSRWGLSDLMPFKSPQKRIMNRILKWGIACSSLVLGFGAQSQEIPAGCRGSGLGISLFVSENSAAIGDTLVYDALVFNTAFPACQATEITASVTTPDGVVHPIVLRRNLLNPSESDYYENVAEYIIRQEDMQTNAGETFVTAGAETKGRIQQNEEDSDGGGFQNVNTVIRNPCIDVTVDCMDAIGENGLLQYNGTVTNCGNNRLNEVFVVYNLGGQEIPVLGPINLAIGESVDFSFSFNPADPCLPASPEVIARGRNTLSTAGTVSDVATAACQLQLTPSVVLETFCPSNAVAGQPYMYSGLVTNNGNVTLTGVVVTGDMPAPGTIVFERATLAPGESAPFTGSFLAPLACEVTTNFSVNTSSVCAANVGDSSILACPLETNPSISVSNFCSATPIVSGQSFQYNGIVSNTGNVTLNNIQVLADSSAIQNIVFTQNSLLPGASAEFTVTANAPLNTCEITTVLTAQGRDICTDEIVEDQSSTLCPVQTNGSVSIVHNCPPVAPQPGSDFSFDATVTNTGNVTLSNLTVFANLPVSDTEVHSIASLAPGASETFTVTLTVPLNTCAVTTVLRVAALDNCGFNQVTDTSVQDCLVDTTPNIDVSMICANELVLPGHSVNFTGAVTNSGDIQLNDVVVVHNFNGVQTTVFGPVSLAPGQTADFSGTFTAPEGINACDITSNVVATATEPCASSQITDQASATCSLLTRPAIRVIRDCPPNPVAQGSILTYNGTVINEGNITLTNIIVYSDRPASNTEVFTVARLEPGQTASFTGSFEVPSNCCAVVDTLRAEGTDICTGETVMDTTTTSCPVLYTPLVEITKVCPTEPAAIGDVVDYEGVVMNTGDITLINLFVYGSIQGSEAPYLGPINLAPGESVSYQASFVVSEENCGQETVTVAATSLCGDVEVSDSVTSACPIVVSPGVEILSFCPQGPLVRGMASTYSGIIINTGDVSLSGVTVRSVISIHNGAVSEGSMVLGPDVIIGPGESFPFTYDAFIPDDADCCELVSQLVVTGQSFCTSEEVTNTSTSVCQIQTHPAIDVEFTECPASILPVGAWVEYFGVVTNTGDIILDNVTVTATVNGEERVLIDSIMLAPGETELFTTMFEKSASGNVQPLVAIAEGFDNCSGKMVLDASVCNPGAVETFGVNSIESNGSNELVIRANVLPGRLYMLQYSNGLANGVWVDIDKKVVADSSSVTFTEHYDSGVAARFYRVVEIR